jgi:hypothetical protein
MLSILVKRAASPLFKVSVKRCQEYVSPTTNSITVIYTLENVENARLIISDPATNTTHNYTLCKGNNSININISGYGTGVYNVLLICDTYPTATSTFVKL